MKTIKKTSKISSDNRNSDKEIDSREIRFMHRFDAEQKLKTSQKRV